MRRNSRVLTTAGGGAPDLVGTQVAGLLLNGFASPGRGLRTIMEP